MMLTIPNTWIFIFGEFYRDVTYTHIVICVYVHSNTYVSVPFMGFFMDICTWMGKYYQITGAMLAQGWI